MKELCIELGAGEVLKLYAGPGRDMGGASYAAVYATEGGMCIADSCEIAHEDGTKSGMSFVRVMRDRRLYVQMLHEYIAEQDMEERVKKFLALVRMDPEKFREVSRPEWLDNVHESLGRG